MLANHAADHYVPLSTHYEQDGWATWRTFDRLMAERHQAQQRLSASETYLRGFCATRGRLHRTRPHGPHHRVEPPGQNGCSATPATGPGPATGAAHHSGDDAGCAQQRHAAVHTAGTGPMVDKRGSRSPAPHGPTHSDRNLAVGDGQGDHFVAHAFRAIFLNARPPTRPGLSEAKLRGVTDNLPRWCPTWTPRTLHLCPIQPCANGGAGAPTPCWARTMRDWWENGLPHCTAPLKRVHWRAETVEFDVQKADPRRDARCTNIYVARYGQQKAPRAASSRSSTSPELKTVEQAGLACQGRSVDPTCQPPCVRRKATANTGRAAAAGLRWH